MNIQKSFPSVPGRGELYLVGTPIGNLEDMTVRAIRILGEVNLVAAEDTRQTRKLMTHFNIQTPLHSYHEHNKEQSAESLLNRLKQGERVALVSDAGMPAISDPGYELVVEAIKEGIAVIPIPGANAALCGLISSGLPTNRFLFVGFLPRTKNQRKESLEQLVKATDTLLFYESPHRIKASLDDMMAVFGEREVAIAREITKRYEEWFRGHLSEAIVWLDKEGARGEYCIIVKGSNDTQADLASLWWALLTIEDHVKHWVDKGFNQKDAIKGVAKERNIPKREVYEIVHIKNHRS